MQQSATKQQSDELAVAYTRPLSLSYRESIDVSGMIVVHKRSRPTADWEGGGKLNINGYFVGYELRTIKGHRSIIFGNMLAATPTELERSPKALAVAVKFIVERENKHILVNAYEKDGTGEFGYEKPPSENCKPAVELRKNRLRWNSD